MSEPVVLRFTVRKKVLKKDLTTPFNKMIFGSGQPYAVEFGLDDEWRGFSCVAAFVTEVRTYYVPLVSGKANIPEEALQHKKFSVSVVGQKGNTRLTTNENQVIQTGGK